MFEFGILSCLLIAFGIGSNDSSNALAICTGSGIISLKKAIFLFGILVFLGIMLNGNKIIQTVGKDLIFLKGSIITVSLIISATLIILSNLKKMPLSTHQVIIGSLIGSGLAVNAKIDFLILFKIILSWLISPFFAGFFSFFIYKILEKFISKLSFFQLENILRTSLLLSAGLISYNTGANELATVLAPVVNYSNINKIFLYFISTLSLFLGTFFLSHRVINTVGKGITALDPYSGFCAQFGAGICVLIFTLLGMPISTTYCIIGSISGVGLTKGFKTIKISLLKRIILNWVISPSIAFLISYLLTLFSFSV